RKPDQRAAAPPDRAAAIECCHSGVDTMHTMLLFSKSIGDTVHCTLTNSFFVTSDCSLRSELIDGAAVQPICRVQSRVIVARQIANCCCYRNEVSSMR